MKTSTIKTTKHINFKSTDINQVMLLIDRMAKENKKVIRTVDMGKHTRVTYVETTVEKDWFGSNFNR